MNAQRKLYYAKSGLSTGKKLTVGEHIDLVASYAAQFGDPLDMRSKAELAGLFHDFGKYSEAFQKVLRGDKYGVDHAICGASFLYRKAIEYDQILEKAGYDQIIEAINGHHDGLRYINDINVHLKNNITQDKNISINNGKESALHGSQYKEAEAAFLTDHPNYHLPRFKDRIADDLLYMLSTRMLFSCLVDADYSVSAFEEDESYFTKSTDNSFDAKRYLGALYAYRAAIQSQSTSDLELNAIRDKLFDACGACGESSAEGLFTLTAPTGTGKTLALLHFALKHCSATGKKRIILVLPFLTLAEQNTETYQAIIPNLLVDHSGRELDDDEREFASRWTSPFIITTSVKFFESLFSHKPSECRKLHHIANSVVLFDEAQSIPPAVTSATLQTVNALCEQYHTTMVFSTATQPSFAELRTIQWNPKEIMPEYRELYRKLKRTNVEWRLDKPYPIETIADEMAKCSNVCGIFNLRRHARSAYHRLYDLLTERGEEESLFLLSTDLCPAHRSHVIAEIKERQKAGLPCRIVSTQCIEAGVDLDFRILYRALAPLDSIIQAAGRCNRNGREAVGRVVVFKPLEMERMNIYPDDSYGNAAKLVELLAWNGSMDGGIDIHNPNDIHRYYKTLFKLAKDKKNLTEAIKDRNYEKVEHEYRLVENAGIKVIVPYKESSVKLDNTMREELTEKGITPALMKQAAPITVNIFDTNQLEEFAESIRFRIHGRKSERESGYYLLRPQHNNCYSNRTGLQFDHITQKSSYIL